MDAPRPLDPAIEGPLDRETALAFLDRAGELLDLGQFAEAARHYQRVIGFPEAEVTAAALLGLGQALLRLDREADAISAWQSILGLPETPATYQAWRELAAARVRDGELAGALAAYREAERRAPPEDRPEIASRLGWLMKETGDARAARRYFARARGAGAGPPVTWLTIGLTVIVTVTAWSTIGDPDLDLYRRLQLDKAAVAAGEYWRLWTIVLLHGQPPFGYLHVFFNMYALYLAGPIVERLYGPRLFVLFYLLCAAAGSVASFAFGGDAPSVGASGAIFGLFGVLFAAARAHQPVLDRSGRMFLGSLGTILLFNLLFGFANAGIIDNAGHVGGLAAGLWLGYLLVPGRVPTLAALWQRPTGTGGGPTRSWTAALRVRGIVALILILVVGLVIGTDARLGR